MQLSILYMSLILIYGNEDDDHIVSITNELSKQDAQFIVFKKYHPDYFVSHLYESGALRTFIRIDKNRFEVGKDIKSLLWRPKPTTNSEIDWTGCDKKSLYAVNDWWQTIAALDLLKNNLKIINPIYAEISIDSKFNQLKLASELGLQIPLTLISNDFLEISKCFESGNVAIKSISTHLDRLGRLRHTQRKLVENIITKPENITFMPFIYQRFIEKDHELRIIIVKDDIFIGKINCLTSKSDNIDWRLTHQTNHYSIGSLSIETREKLLAFHKRSGLIIASYDFIVDVNGNEIFLECNPSGNWLFLGKEFGQAVTEKIATVLME